MSWWETTPLWLAGSGLLAALLLGVELGYRGGPWINRRLRSDTEGDGQNHLLAAVLGLLALLLGFTFSLSLDRYETRRDLVVQEANALGTAWLRAQLLEEPARTTVSGRLRDYVRARLAWSRAAHSAADLSAADAAQSRLWAAVGTAMRSDPSPQLTRGLMDAVNESFDLAASRVFERKSHIPDQVLHVLLLYSLLSAVMLGYVLASDRRPHRIATFLTLTLISLALVLILDLDRPRSGAIQVSQQPLGICSRRSAPPRRVSMSLRSAALQASERR